MIALSDNPSIPRSGADDYCPEKYEQKITAFTIYLRVQKTKNTPLPEKDHW